MSVSSNSLLFHLFLPHRRQALPCARFSLGLPDARGSFSSSLLGKRVVGDKTKNIYICVCVRSCVCVKGWGENLFEMGKDWCKESVSRRVRSNGVVIRQS